MSTSKTIKRGFNTKYNQDTLDIWLVRDGLNLIFDHNVKEVSPILNDLGWRSDMRHAESLAFEDKIGFFLFRADKVCGEDGIYDLSSQKDLREDLDMLVDDMNAVLEQLNYEIEFGDLNYVIQV